ncbi:hypothetical protein [Legionella sp. km772]|uniref:hypothetical protein n=1 Tax=Legionella sp. km772 TaxID=2498111 RepID=UPI000F8C3AC0|nr:hypothetical protein [Legionella sp. km772]RUR05080.1 hypothetical protein ELY15_14760 [Legionella sp. km772]
MDTLRAITFSAAKRQTAFYGTLLLLLFLSFVPKAQAEYPCPLGFYYAVNEGCVPNYNTYNNVVWGTTVVPAYGYYDGATYNADYDHSYDGAGYHYGAYNGVGHYNWGGANYYHRNWGGGAYYHR